jgi:hypothetical protein
MRFGVQKNNSQIPKSEWLRISFEIPVISSRFFLYEQHLVFFCAVLREYKNQVFTVLLKIKTRFVCCSRMAKLN